MGLDFFLKVLLWTMSHTSFSVSSSSSPCFAFYSFPSTLSIPYISIPHISTASYLYPSYFHPYIYPSYLHPSYLFLSTSPSLNSLGNMTQHLHQNRQ
ncbi:hypothetical protein BDV97DRAFT_111127 [Delphinella strobiligena]|nr:hypothetical protein BDV97DRAFT_111127 [Delphinella strobiligena]